VVGDMCLTNMGEGKGLLAQALPCFGFLEDFLFYFNKVMTVTMPSLLL